MFSISQTRKDSVIAEVKWYYRVSELPESVYSLLMDDRKEGADVCAVANLFAIKLRRIYKLLPREI